MDDRGVQTQMPRGALPRDSQRSEGIVWGVAIMLAVLFAVGQALTVLAAAPAAIAFYRGSAVIPWFVTFVDTLGWAGLALFLAALNGALATIAFWLARKYWIGFAYVPPMVSMGTGAIMLWLLLSAAVSGTILHG